MISFKDYTAENFFFYHVDEIKEQPPDRGGAFDAQLGWRASPASKMVGQNGNEGLNSQFWRSDHEYQIAKIKPRILLIGDSFIYGLRLADKDTIPAQLQAIAGNEFEIMNMAAAAYGLDQMALVATEVAPPYHPDYLVISFIGDDLHRSCTGYLWDRKKPYFVQDGDRLEVRGRPVPTFEENLALHREFSQRWKDRFATWITKSRVISLVAQPFLKNRKATCESDLNADLLQYIYERVPSSTRLLFVHLAGEMPESLVQNTNGISVPYISLVPEMERLRRLAGVTPGFVDGFHPDRNGAKILALGLWEAIQNQARGPASHAKSVRNK